MHVVIIDYRYKSIQYESRLQDFGRMKFIHESKIISRIMMNYLHSSRRTCEHCLETTGGFHFPVMIS